MPFAYTTGPRRRLILGDSQASHRLCLPVSREVYDAILALPVQDQEQLVSLFKVALREALGAWQTLGEIEALSAESQRLEDQA